MTADVRSRPRAPPLAPLLLAAGAVAVLAAEAALWLAAPQVVRPPFMLSGAAIGLLVGLTGVGGGSLMTPVLILLFGLHPASAVGADLLYASATKAVGTGVHAAGRTVDWALVRLMALGSVPATLLTLTAMKLTGLGGEKSSHGLSVALGFVLLLTAAALLFRDPLLRLARAPEGRTRRPNATAALTVALGAVLGVLITLTSVGAGALGVTLLVFLYPRMPIARVVGSDIVHAVPLTLIAGVGHWWMGSVDLSLVASLLMGSIPGVIVGGLLAPRTPERVLRPILAAVLVLVGWKLAFK